MNNQSRGIIFGLFLLGAIGLGFGAMLAATPSNTSTASGAQLQEYLRVAIVLGLGAVACAVIAAGALAGMQPAPPRQVMFPQPGAPGAPGVPPQQAYPPHAAPYPPQYGQPGPQPGSPQQG